MYGGEVEIEVQIEEGSLITRVTVVGSILLGVYNFVANYKGFKEGVVEMCNDAREFAVDVCDPFINKAGVPKEEVYRFERRLKVPGKLYRFGKRLEKLEKSVDELSPRDVQKELGELRSEFESIEDLLSSEERHALRPVLKRAKLPFPENWPQPEEPKAILRRDDDLEQSLLFGDQGPPQGIPEDHKPRIVFREVAKVPRRKNGRRNKRRQLMRPDLLS